MAPAADPRCTTAKLATSQLIAWGVLYYTYGASLPYMRAELGWSEARLSLGFSLALLVSGVLAPLVGGWIDQHGSRTLMTTGAVVGAIGVWLWSSATTLGVYLLAWILIGAAMAATLYEPAFATVVRAHPRQSRRSIFTITLVGGLASTVFVPVSVALFGALGWRLGALCLAGLFAALVIPLHARLPACRGSVRPALRSRASLSRLAMALVLANLVTTSVVTYVLAYAMQRGETEEVAAGLAAMIGIAKLGGRLATILARWFSASRLLGLGLAVQSAALFVPVMSSSTLALVWMVIGFGATSGALTILRPLLLLETYGEHEFARRNGALQMFTTFARSVAPVGMGLAIGWVGYRTAWAGLAVLAMSSAVILMRRKEAVLRR